MIEIIQSTTFSHWLNKLKDRQARARIHVRLDRMKNGNLGDVKPIGEGLSEARIHYGKGYRLYFLQRRSELIVLLCGGDKSTQNNDIEQAKHLAQKWKE